MMTIITISRQYGSGGDEIAARVCEILGYRYFDKNLMAEVATDVGLSPTEIVDFSEDNYHVRGFLERLWSGGRSSRVVAQVGRWTEDTSGARVEELAKLDEAQTITFVQSIVEAAYRHGNVVIVGRGGQAILKDRPWVFHVQVQAPLALQSQRLHEIEKVSLAEAREMAINHDRATADYLKRFYHINWLDPQLYDLMINTTKFKVEAAAQLIASAIRHLPQ
jgi:cytidylate kinase